MRRTGWAAFALALTITLGAHAQPPVVRAKAGYPMPLEGASVVDGPVRSADDIRSFELLGLRLGMPLADAHRILEAQGFKQRFPVRSVIADTAGKAYGPIDAYWGKEENDPPLPPRQLPDGTVVIEATALPTNIVSLRYVMLDGQPAKLAGVTYDPPFSPSRRRDVAARRAELVERYGQPTWWRKLVTGYGNIADTAMFTTGRELADQQRLGTISACLHDWQHQRACYKIDCQKLLASAAAPAFKIEFGGYHSYYLEDFAAQYTSLSRDPKFMSGKTEKVCEAAPIH